MLPSHSDKSALLVIDHSRTMRQAVRATSQRLGLSVIESGSMVEGLGIMVRERPSAVVAARSSCELPGEAFVAAVRSTGFLCATPIAIMAAVEEDGSLPGVPGADTVIPRSELLSTALATFLEPLGLVPGEGVQHRLAGRILLVEDTELIQRLLSRVLHAAGATVVVARDGIEAITAAARDRFDLILMDIEMPRLDGPAALRAIREAGIRTPALAATAHGPQYADRAKELGFVGVLDKQQRPADIVLACSRYA